MQPGDLKSVEKDAQERMKKAVEHLMDEYKAIRTGRANVGILDNILVEYYGQKMPLNQVGNLGTPDPHTIVIDPWDKSVIPAVEKAIETSDLGLNPSNDGNIIRVPIPMLTEERRKEFIKVAKKKAEDAKIAVRNVRRDANEHAKKIEKEGHVSEDMVKKTMDDIQKITDKFIHEIDEVFHRKEKEILEV